MKHVKLFEQFIAEAANDDRIKEIQAEIDDINDQIEELQDASDSGKMDPDEAELQMSDLDAFKVELEGEMEDLKKGGAKASPIAKKLKALAWTYTGFYQGGEFKDSNHLRYEADGTTDKKAKAKLLQIAAKIEKQEAQQNQKSEKAKKEFDKLFAANKEKLSTAEEKYLSWLVSDERLNAQGEFFFYKKKAETAARLNKEYGTKEGEAEKWMAKAKEAHPTDTEHYRKTEELAAAAGLA